MKSLNEIVAELRMGDDCGKPAYRIGRADKVEVSMPSGTSVRSYVIECVTIKELADWIEAAVARERGPGNAAAMREALEEILRYLELICKHAKPKGEQPTALFAAAETVRDMVVKALSAPARQCDVGTPEEQNARYEHYCFIHRTMERCCQDCPIKDEPCCELAWAQTPYEAQEGVGE